MKDRLIASAIHASISLLLAGLILLLLFLVWFPSPLMNLGAVQGVQLILLVDLVAGPLLTLLVFKRGKPRLIFDMSVIVLLQLVALGYGLTAVYGQTPAFLVATHEGVFVVTRYEVEHYMEPKNLGVFDDLMENSKRYEGHIPFFKLNETAQAGYREVEHLAFLFNQGLPYQMNSKVYTPLDSFQYLLDAKSAYYGVEKPEHECVVMRMISNHGEANVCLYIDGDAVRSD